jgi:RHH-type transcriptional regulator, proline utilization regulon repressor / proline dehydrogenase / delta 1-pyrroline-5-carboxylate dehydrogenase
MDSFPPPPPQQRLPDPYRAEAGVVNALLARSAGLDWPAVIATAAPWVAGVRGKPAPFWAMESLLREYPITSAEGLALMRLAEALLRVPDAETAIALTADQLGRADFDEDSEGPHKVFATLAGSAISLSKKFLPDPPEGGGLMQRLGAKTVVAATVRAIQLLGRQFVLGRHIGEAMAEAAAQRKEHAALRFSYDMLGEGARTERDAERYLHAYQGAIAAIAKQKTKPPEDADGISIKLSALFSRYEDAQRERVFAILLPRVWSLVDAAARANMNLTIDAEESDRLELSLDVLEALAARIAAVHPQWRGFGLAVQAYQTRALEVIDAVAAIAKQHGLRFMVRLVKGAYWDGEIKRAQELGLPGYPVFTHKQHTDIAYLACAQALIGHAEVIYPQFATHNASTLAAIVQMAGLAKAQFELQRLHGMGEGVYREFTQAHLHADTPLRIYAPVGEHRDLLAYLVRRLLENGANSSFVHQLTDDEVPIELLLASPLARIDAQALPMPVQLYGAERANSRGADLSCMAHRNPLLDALRDTPVGAVPEASFEAVNATLARLQAGFAAWSSTPVAERAAVLQRAADALDAQLAPMCALLVQEAHKGWADAVAEVREAVDFLRYYGVNAVNAGQHPLPLQGRGVWVCISPWNFPLAIFAGQVAAALVAGNAVAAKPAEQTPFVAQRMVDMLHAAGVPRDALALVHGAGETVGAQLVADARCAGVAFTGSTQVAHIIHRTLAAKEGAVAPLIAETGGLNVMVVDSTALPEQVIDAVVQSAFRSAGQRCSALRVLCVHESIADGMLEMLAGAMAELHVGNPAELHTDVGPLIDAQAHANIQRAVQRLHREAKLIASTPLQGQTLSNTVAPIAFEIRSLAQVKEEIFGPVLQVLRWRGEVDALVDQINALGYGLTLGVQTRIDSRALRIAERAKVGNVYVNRNMIGAVVGVQPFGGEGLSGTGPKAGGPHYLARFAADTSASKTLSLGAWNEGVAVNVDWAAMQAAQSAWAERPLHERLAVLAPLLPPDERQAVAQALAEHALPGPTGESNTLRLHGRGVWAVLAEGATRLDANAAVARCLAAGNAVLCAGATDIILPGLAAGLLRTVPESTTAGLLSAPTLAGVCIVAGDDSTARPVQRALAARGGAILPLLTGSQWRRSDQLNRFAAEQTVTINTAAAGGNAALLAGI